MASAEERLIEMLRNAKDKERFLEIARSVILTLLAEDTEPPTKAS